MNKDDVMLLLFDVMRIVNKPDVNITDYASIARGQGQCLFFIEQYEGISQKQLANMMKIRSTSLSEIISKLESKNYVKRERSESDKRTFLLYLTPEGKKEISRRRDLKAERKRDIIDCLSADEMNTLSVILKKIKEANNKE